VEGEKLLHRRLRVLFLRRGAHLGVRAARANTRQTRSVT